MAAFLLIRDASVERRLHTATAATNRIGTFNGLTIGSHDSGPLTLVWGVMPGAPFDRASLDHRHALIMGDALADGADERTTAVDLLRTTHARPTPIYDGFHAALTYDDAGGFEISVDILGLLPLYHVTLGDIILVATSPSLFHSHPLFRGTLDPFGLAAVLATNGLVSGHTVYAGVRRLDQGHALMANPGSVPKEEHRYTLPITKDLREAPLDVCARELHDALRFACRRHVPEGEAHSLMLSGGLDSRMIAGVLAREGRTITAVTRGHSSDIEYRCAHAVAEHLGIEHHRVPHIEQGAETFPGTIQWEGLTASPGTGSSGTGAKALRRFHTATVTGYLATAVLGGSHINWSDGEGVPAFGFDWIWKRIARWGLPFEVLERLLRRDVFGTALHDVRDALRHLYTAAGDTEHERVYRSNMLYRQRFGIGDVLNSLSFGAWPRSPHADREVLRVAGAVPPAILAGRRLQTYILKRFHLGLACLPLDRNSYDVRPLEPRVVHQVGHAVSRYVRNIRLRAGVHKERRYYARTYDINGEHWHEIRRLMEPFRERAYTVFERKIFDELVPAPDANVPTRDGIQDVSGLKMLLGFLAMQPLLSEGS